MSIVPFEVIVPEKLWELPGDESTTKIDEEEYRQLINRYRDGK